MAEDEHPFVGYNKIDNQAPTLVGNWQEERSLRDMTGVTRYETQEIPTATGVTVKMVDLPTHPRVIEHTSAVATRDWSSSQKLAYQPVGEQPLLSSYKGVPGMGPRELMELEQLAKEAAEVPDEELFKVTGRPIPPETESTYRAGFKEHDLTGMEVGARVMKDLDGRPAQRDPTFLAETQIVQKQLADRIFGETARKMGATDTHVLPSPDVPVTIYSEAVASKTYGGTFQGTLTTNHKAPFNKYANFSKPMSDYSKVVIDE